ncbi:MAG: PAS domain S-box protein [Desulfotignum sp.]|jgi:PAS domain S-box-containing protein|nr:PAS domain S-box protein [Desulfotignum sp.]
MADNPTYEALQKRVQELEPARADREKSIMEFDHLFFMALDLICIADIHTTFFIKVNPACRDILGFSEEEMLDRPFFDFIHPDDIAPTRQVVEKKLHQGEKIINFENRYICKDGQYKWLSWVSHPSPEKGVTYAIARDITKEKMAEKALQESERRYRSLYENAQAGLARTRISDGRVLECNKKMAQIFGYDDVQTFIKAYVLSENYADKAQREAFITELENTGKIRNREAAFFRKDGSKIWVRFDTRLVPEHGYMEDVVIDITDQKNAMEERSQLQSQLLQAQKMESVGRLAGGVAHDFNNMLTVIIGYTQTALGQVDPAGNLHKNLQGVLKAAQRSADLTKQLLAFARKQIIDPRVLDLNHTVETMLKMLRRLIGEDIHLLWRPAGKLQPVKMDPSQIDQILANLCVNAKDAIGGVGKITIETGMKTFDTGYCRKNPGFSPGEFVMLAVSDDGCGMDKETLNNLFEPFFTTKDVGQGTGLGLATIYGIVKQNNGFIKVYSEPDYGTCFHIYLPCHAEKMVKKPENTPQEIPTGNGETILIVEDEKTILEMLTTMLQDLHYTIIAAPTPHKAMALAQKHAGKIHLLLTDVVMPEMNGRDLAAQLATLYPKLKFLFMSGYTANVIAHQGVLDEGVQFIQKPFSMKDIAVKIQNVLDGADDGKNQTELIKGK